MVLQCCCHLLLVLTRASIRSRIQSVTDLVSAKIHEYNTMLIYTSGELEMTVNILIQIDKLVQLIESPVFTCELPNHEVIFRLDTLITNY